MKYEKLFTKKWLVKNYVKTISGIERFVSKSIMIQMISKALVGKLGLKTILVGGLWSYLLNSQFH